MKQISFSFLRLLFAAVVTLAPALSGCSTGTDAGDTNVEIGHTKDKDGASGGNEAKQGEGHRDNERGADR